MKQKEVKLKQEFVTRHDKQNSGMLASGSAEHRKARFGMSWLFVVIVRLST